MDQMSIGEFAKDSRLSAKALRLFDELGLLPPACRALAAYVIDELSGKRSVMYEVSTRDIPERALLCVKRNVAGVDKAWAFGKEFIDLLRRYQLPQIPGQRRRVLLYLLG